MSKRFLPVALLAFAVAACGPVEQDLPEIPPADETPVSDLDALFAGAPDNASLPDDNKADAVYPAKFGDEIVAFDSPIKSQGSRGTCSIFATTALMEQLYQKAGMENADFSEQYLQWSVKTEVGDFPHTDGSNTRSNLEAINRFGIVTEADWPYESRRWGASQDPECTGDEMPTRCYTNGEPPQHAAAAEKFHLPRGRWVSTRSLKAHMNSKKTGVVVAVKFFYQAWNHGGSKLSTNREYFASGYVTYPNAADKEDSLERPAGHAVLLVGWDDELEVPMRDGSGELVVDEEGNPVKEKGFYIFKNSWGTGSFGRNHPYGPGYGYISQKYVEEYGSAYTSDAPDLAPEVEICGDGEDNDGNGLTDCDDEACAATEACTTEPVETLTYFSEEQVAIPDNDPSGIATDIVVDDSATVGTVTILVDVTHTYQGDLHVVLERDGREIVLHDRTGGGTDDLIESYTLTDFAGTDVAGTWTLKVSDLAGSDTGTLNGWMLEVVPETP